jgi:type I restriction enzyme S subunit
MAIELSEKQIKDGWQIVKFGEIAKEVKSTTKDPAEDGLEFYVGLEHLDPQSLRISRKGIIAEDNPSFTRRFSAGQILFGKRRCYQKKAAVADFEGICSGDIIVMDAIPKKIIPGLLPFIIQSDAFFDWAEKTSSGSLSPRTKWKSLAEFEFPLPPIERQKEILEVLEKVDACINLNEEMQNISATIIQKITNIALGFTGGNIKLKEGRLSDILKVKNGYAFKSSQFRESGKPIVRISNIMPSRKVDLSDCIYYEQQESCESFSIKKGDILIAMSGATTGKSAIFDHDVICYQNQRVGKIEPKNGNLADFIYHILGNENLLNLMLIDSIGGAQPNISPSNIERCKIKYPSEKQQHSFSEALNAATSAFYEFGKKSRHLKTLSRNILQKEVSNELQ